MAKCRFPSAYIIRDVKLFGRTHYQVLEAGIRSDCSVSWVKTSGKPPTFRNKDDALKNRYRKNAGVVLIDKKDDVNWLLKTAKRVGLKEEELEGYSNLSIIGEIQGSDSFPELAKEFDKKVSMNIKRD